MSLILLEKQGEAWRSRVEGHFILGIHPIETVRKGLPEAMAQAVVDHCVMSGEDAQDFVARLVREVAALVPVKASQLMTVDRAHEWQIAVGSPVEPRRARVPRRAAVVALEAEQAPAEPMTVPTEDI